MNKLNGFLIALTIISVLSLFGVIYLFSYLVLNTSWETIAQVCPEQNKTTGQEWVDQNCRYLDGKTMCEFIYDGQKYTLPVEQIDINSVEGCEGYIWYRNAFIKTNPAI